jgi:hypothetical protein
VAPFSFNIFFSHLFDPLPDPVVKAPASATKPWRIRETRKTLSHRSGRRGRGWPDRARAESSAAVLRGKYFYYFGNETINRRVAAFGYISQSANPDEVFTRIVRVRQSGEEKTVRDIGVRIILRERETWVVRGTLKQLRSLSSSGYKLEALGRREPQPRRIQLVLSRREDVARIGGEVEIDHVGNDNNGYLIVIGEAFDDAIDDLRARGFKVEILPDFPGAIR